MCLTYYLGYFVITELNVGNAYSIDRKGCDVVKLEIVTLVTSLKVHVIKHVEDIFDHLPLSSTAVLLVSLCFKL